MVDGLEIAERHLAEHRQALAAIDSLLPELVKVGELFISSLQEGRKILFFGNGGSAADCQHLATELVVRYRRDRRGLAAIALTTDTSAITAAANDFGYEHVFERQLHALGRPGDIAVGISTSGTSPSIVQGLKAAREIGLVSVGMTGQEGGEFPAITDHCLRAPSATTAIIQECHILCGHILCDLVESAFCDA